MTKPLVRRSPVGKKLSPLGELMEEDRINRGLTNDEYRKEIAVATRTYQGLKYGHTTPMPGTLEIIARVLGYANRQALLAQVQVVERARAELAEKMQRRARKVPRA